MNCLKHPKSGGQEKTRGTSYAGSNVQVRNHQRLGILKLFLYVLACGLYVLLIFINPRVAIEVALIVAAGTWLVLSVDRLPEVYVYVLILGVTNVFGVFNILMDWRIAGVGKPSDFVLVFMDLMVLAAFLLRKSSLTKAERRFTALTIILLSYFCFLIVYSSLYKGYESLNYALRDGAAYLYYSSFLFPLFLIDERGQLFRFVNFLRVGGIVTAAIAIISNVVGHNIVTGALSGNYGGFVRVYQVYFFNMFIVGLWVVERAVRYEGRGKIFDGEVLINALGIILFVGRGLIVTTIVMILISFMVVGRERRRGGVLLRALLVGGIGLAGFFSLSELNPAVITERLTKGYTNTLQDRGTMSLRLNAELQGLRIFLESPIVGTGFVHPTSSEYSKLVNAKGYEVTDSADFGLASILFTTGILGFSLILYFLLSVFAYMWKKLKTLREEVTPDFLYLYSVTILVLNFVLFFIGQWTGNLFGWRDVAVELLTLGYAVRIIALETSGEAGAE